MGWLGVICARGTRTIRMMLAWGKTAFQSALGPAGEKVARS